MEPEYFSKIIFQKRQQDWNDYREAMPQWKPDFREFDFGSWWVTLFVELDRIDSSAHNSIPDILERKRNFPMKDRWNLREADFRGTVLKPAEEVYQVVSPNEGIVTAVDEIGHNRRRVRYCLAPDLRGALYDLNTTGGWSPLLKALGARLWIPQMEETIAKNQVFISYAWADGEIVLAVDKWLRERRLTTRLDKRDFFAGARIRDEIARVMVEADVVVIFYSEKAKDRPWTQFEHELAADLEMEAKTLKKEPPRVIYFCIDATELPTVNLRQRLAIRASGRGFTDVCEELYRHILRLPDSRPDEIDLNKWKNYVFPNSAT